MYYFSSQNKSKCTGAEKCLLPDGKVWSGWAYKVAYNTVFLSFVADVFMIKSLGIKHNTVV